MSFFHYNNGSLSAEQSSVAELAQRFGTPLYVYSRAALEQHYRAFDDAFAAVPHQVCYAVKANSNLAVLNVLARLGSGFDIVSGGELTRVLAAGGDASKVVFSGLGKQKNEIKAALEADIACFNVESYAEIARINEVAMAVGKKARISLRVNPDVDAQTHPYISTGLKENKFGIAIDDAIAVYQYADQLAGLEVIGIDCHIGSQLTTTTPFADALDRVLAMIDTLTTLGINIEHIDIGGGLGVCYRDETPPTPAEYANALLPKLQGRNLKVYLEPGRAIAANAGILITKVEFLKPTPYKNFAIIDAAMNDLIRPSLYGAWMDIIPVTPRLTETQVYDVVGAVCETGDFLGKDRTLAIEANDLLAVCGAGAYGFVMSSNYNTRGRAAEIMVDGEQSFVIRRRESIADLLALESMLP